MQIVLTKGTPVAVVGWGMWNEVVEIKDHAKNKLGREWPIRQGSMLADRNSLSSARAGFWHWRATLDFLHGRFDGPSDE